MSYFEGQSPRWAQHGRQQSWDASQGPRSDDNPPAQREDGSAFSFQFEEIARASDNLSKGSRALPMHNRRDSVPVPGSFARQYSEFDSRMGGPSRHHSVTEFDGMRSHSSHSSSSIQGYLSNQRFGAGPRMSEAEQMMQTKRRAAAQRERELRNYHQEQQYNRSKPAASSVSKVPSDGLRPDLLAAKSDRSMSPSAMSEEDRRELIARQHRALYGNESNLYTGDGPSPRQMSQDARVLTGGSGTHGSSPLTFDQFGVPSSGPGESSAALPAMAGVQPRSRSNSNASPAGNPGNFSMFEGNQQPANQTGSSSPGGSPTRAGAKVAAAGGVAPIGTRPVAQVKRNTPPVPSPLSYGFGNDKTGQGQNERSQSAASNPSSSQAEKPVNIGWGSSGNNQGPWGNSSKMQASVWG